MYTKQEISRQKQAFWTAFGRYMKPVLSSDGDPIGWLNYKTGIKHVSFKMDVGIGEARIAVVVHHPDPDMRRNYYEQLLALKNIFEDAVGETDWIRESDSIDEHGKQVSVIQKKITGVHVFRNEDWPAIISFLKPRIIGLDSFWSVVRHQFANFG